jgi:hypothetical protein
VQRAEVAYQIALIARKAAELEALELAPPPTKFLVPFLEKASLEDRDEELHSRWAALLVSASTHYEARHLTFIDIMTRLSSEELVLLEEVCLSQKRFPETTYPGGHATENMQTTLELAPILNFHELPPRRELRAILETFIDTKPLHYGRIMWARAFGGGVSLPLYTEYGKVGTVKFRSLEILEREGLITVEWSERQPSQVQVGYFNVTFLGISFVKDCSPKGREAFRKFREEMRARIVP